MSGVIPTQQTRAADQWPPQSPGQRPYPEMPRVPSDRPLLQSLGASGTAIFSGIITSEEYNPDFYWRDGVKIFEQMLRSDAQIRAVRSVVEQPIKRANWSIEPGSDDARDQEIASFVQSCLFTDMGYTTADGRSRSQTWATILHHILMHLWYGFMCFEVVWKKEDGWVKWAKWQPLLPRTVWRWWVGPDTELVGIQQWTFKDYNYGFVDIPADKLLLFAHQQEGSNFEGVSLLRTAYKHWWYKQQFEKIEAIGIERNAVVPPVVTLPENFTEADIQAAQTLGANMRANELSYATLAPGMLLEYPRNMQPFTSQVQPAIQYHDVMIARNVLAQFINLGSTETGAYALADAQQEMFLEALQAVANYICDVVSADAIKRLVDYNFSGVEVYPRLKCSRLANADISQVADALAKLKARDANFLTPDPEMEDYLRDQFGFPKAPRTVVQATNPTSDANADRPETQPGDHTDQQSKNVSPAGQKPGGNDSSQATAGNNALAPASPGDGGPGLSESAESAVSAEVRLLREAVETIAGLDAVERGMLFFNPNHRGPGPGGGEFTTVGGGGAGESREERSARARAIAARHMAATTHNRVGGSDRDRRRVTRGTATREEYSRYIGHKVSEAEYNEWHEAARPARPNRGGKAKAEGESAAKTSSAPKVEEETTRGGGRSRGSKAEPAEDIHERSARLQREGHLPAEVKPGEQLTPLSGAAERSMRGPDKFDPYATPGHDVRVIINLYGEHQLGASLHHFSTTYVNEAARELGVKPSNSKAATISRLVAHLTGGRYSANFGAKSKADPFAAHAAKAAKLKAALDKAEAAAEKARAAYNAHLAKAPKQASEQSAHAQHAARLLAAVRRAEAAVTRAQAAMTALEQA